MAEGNVVPIKKVEPKAGPDPMLNMEMGVERVLPFTFWSSDREVANVERIKIDDLVEMRRRDGQARALVRLFILPIMSALADGEWIMPEDDGAEDTKPKVVPSEATKPPESSSPEEVGSAPAPLSVVPDEDEVSITVDGEPVEEEEAGPLPGEREVAFANNMWNLPPQAGGMTVSKTTLLKKTLQALTDGFSVFEEVRQVPDEGPLKGLYTLRKMAYRDPRTIRFRVDDKGGFDGVRQVASINGKTVDVKIPKEKIWYWAVNEEENPFYGVSMFESAFYHYEIKRKLYYIAHLAAQFAAVPGRMGKVPKGADPRQVAAFKQSLMNFAFNTAMTYPDGYEVTPFNGHTGFDFIKLIDHHNHMMAKSVIATFLDDEQRTTLIDNTSTDPNTDFFVMALESLMDDISESWSRYLMPKYIDWNFGTKRYPVFKFGQLSDSAKGVITELFKSVVGSSVLNSTPEFVRELEKKLSKSLGLDIDYDEIEQQEKEAAEAEAAQAEAEMKMAEEQAAIPTLPPGAPAPPGAGPSAAPPGGGGPKPPGPKQSPAMTMPPGAPPFVAASADSPSIDELVAMAQALLMERPDDAELTEV